MFDRFISLGDSMSIDHYAGPGLGAASLLHRNVDRVWPDFKNRDLLSANSCCELIRLAENGAAVRMLKETAASLVPFPRPTLVTITMGGNDMMYGIGIRGATLRGFKETFTQVIRHLQTLFPQLTLLIGNVYDPTEGSGISQSGRDFSVKLSHLVDMNGILADLAVRYRACLIDIYTHFRGHTTEWIFRDIEPTGQGSSEIRRLWWNALSAQCETR